MPQTLAQKLIAKAAGRADVTPGEIVTCKVDLAMMHDSGGPRRVKPMLEQLGARVWDPSRVVVVVDHYLPANDDESRKIVRIARDWVRDAGVNAFYDGEGICHVVLPERGHLKPGMFAVGGDSHSPTGGAFGTYMFGIGSTEMLGVLVTGEIWLKVPHTLQMVWSGKLGRGVTAKDIMLFLCTRFGLDGGQYQAVEYAGSAIRALPMQERMTLANMSAEFGAQAGLIAPDEVTRAYLKNAGIAEVDTATWQGDPDAPLLARHEFDADALAPQVAAPHSPANAHPVGDLAGTPLDAAYIGACTGAKLEDLRMAAAVLKGRKIAPGMRLLLAPASLQDQRVAAAEGTLAAIVDAGAQLIGNACGACAGYGAFQFGEKTRVISSTARNFRGRMGADSAEIYLGNPYTVAASALAGRIADPRELIE